jgi:hypothetical protein
MQAGMSCSRGGARGENRNRRRGFEEIAQIMLGRLGDQDAVRPFFEVALSGARTDRARSAWISRWRASFGHVRTASVS